ncbi:hypothetical protein EVAR_90004_1 [Eumeta japonica]|uniref:Uncharacterized protein n=1 Tax=Eumeta variegata TaxID=151549 RepID=A0A4C2ABW2_EUMVA|nr:hypothetical protein EVAR_90004_1 [Eumeta japonica]
MKSRGTRFNRCLAALLRFGPYDLDVGGAMGGGGTVPIYYLLLRCRPPTRADVLSATEASYLRAFRTSSLFSASSVCVLPNAKVVLGHSEKWAAVLQCVRRHRLWAWPARFDVTVTSPRRATCRRRRRAALQRDN